MSTRVRKRVYYLRMMKAVFALVFASGARTGEILGARLHQLVYLETTENGTSELALSIKMRGSKVDRDNNKMAAITVYEDGQSP